MVFLKISIPKKESKEDKETDNEAFSASKDFKEVIGIMSHLYDSLYSVYSSDYINIVIGQDFFSLEYCVIENSIHFYIVCPRNLSRMMEKQITSFYPDVFLEEVEDYNIFRPNHKIAGMYLKLTKKRSYPIKTFLHIPSDPLNNMTNALSKMEPEEGAAIQIIIRPRKNGWQKKGRELAQKIFTESKAEGFSLWKPFSALGKIFNILVYGPDKEIGKENWDQQKSMTRTTPMTDEQVKAIEEKNTKSGFETIIRVITSSPTKEQAKENLNNIYSSFEQFSSTDNNGFIKTKYHSLGALITNYIYRNLARNWTQRLSQTRMILSTDELASLFHLPNIKYNKTPTINWINFKIAPAPPNLPKEGLLLGHNIYRGAKKEVRIKNEDRFRHVYVIGQTGTGKSSIMQVMLRQDFAEGKGVCVVDPHGSLIADIFSFIPRERADDVIYFNPADLDRPLGLNLLEAETEEEKELVALDAMNIMIKLFDEETFGPRIQDYFRNGVLTLMADPEGGALTDIVRLFTDDDFQKYKVKFVKNPVIRSFWEHQMAKTGAREKQEMIPYFAAKFGQFVSNTMMRNIIGQAKSSFNFESVMQENKILLMNLSKGVTGEINSKLLGMIIVSKLQTAALRREKYKKDERQDFFLYIDEFQNYITDTIESILSEARKYRLGLVMAHQYIKQLEGADGKSKVKDAVFGNVGTMVSYKIGAQDAEYMAKEMAPVFSEQDLINIDKFKAVMKLSIDTQPSRPFSIIPVNPYTEKGDLEAVEAMKQLSRLKYGRDKEFVNREIIRRIGASEFL